MPNPLYGRDMGSLWFQSPFMEDIWKTGYFSQHLRRIMEIWWSLSTFMNEMCYRKNNTQIFIFSIM